MKDKMMELREQVADIIQDNDADGYIVTTSIYGLEKDWEAYNIRESYLNEADEILAIDEISQALKLMDMIPEGKECGDCDFVVPDQVSSTGQCYCGVIPDHPYLGVDYEVEKHPDCPKLYKGETE